MKELDLLKKDWDKNKDSFSPVSEKEIYKMIHKKSSSIVKWILIISIIEVIFWTTINIVFNSDDYFKTIANGELLPYFKGLNVFNYLVILIFIYLFYKNYIRISTTVATKQLMKDILKTRKTVHYYVGYNLGMILISLIIGFVIAFSYNPEISLLKEKMEHNTTTMVITLGVLFLTVILIFGFFWLFYRIIYGTLLRRLQTNYKELKKIEI
jgi:hypothetical protein